MGAVDLDILRLLARHRTPVLTTIAQWAMDIGTNDLILLLAGLAMLGVVIAGRWWQQGIAIGASVLVAQALARGLKGIVARARPPADLAVVQVGAFSMPSTVAAMTAALAVALYSIVPWRVGHRRPAAGLLAAFVVLIGFAMVYLGAHWPTDVLAGWSVGMVVGVAVVRLTRMMSR